MYIFTLCCSFYSSVEVPHSPTKEATSLEGIAETDDMLPPTDQTEPKTTTTDDLLPPNDQAEPKTTTTDDLLPPNDQTEPKTTTTDDLLPPNDQTEPKTTTTDDLLPPNDQTEPKTTTDDDTRPQTDQGEPIVAESGSLTMGQSEQMTTTTDESGLLATDQTEPPATTPTADRPLHDHEMLDSVVLHHSSIFAVQGIIQLSCTCFKGYMYIVCGNLNLEMLLKMEINTFFYCLVVPSLVAFLNLALVTEFSA